MNFTDYIFIPALLLVVLIYFITPIRRRWIILLISSLLFYASWGVEMLPFIVCSTLVVYVAAILIDKKYRAAEIYGDDHSFTNKEEKTVYQRKVKKRCRDILFSAVIFMFLVLIYFKAQRYMAEVPYLENVVWLVSKVYQKLAEFFANIPGISLLVTGKEETVIGGAYSFFMPLGISYYTLSLVGYLVDVYWKKEKATYNYAKLLLFATYFPKIVEGPISKHRLIAKQLEEGHAFEYRRFCYGLQRMLWGYFKKLVIADRIALLTGTVFTDYSSYSGSVYLVTAIFSAFELYCDFSGCMDIALGASEIFGIQIEENFNRPFFSQSAAEFWRRWHMTMSAWFRDYLFMPISRSNLVKNLSKKCGKRFGTAARKKFIICISSVAVWLATGTWHGTGWNYVLWGIYWCVLINISNIFGSYFVKFRDALKINESDRWFQRFRILRTFTFFLITRFITVPNDLKVTAYMLKSIFKDFEPWNLFDGSLYKLGMERSEFILVVLCIVFLLAIEKRQEAGIRFREVLSSKPIVLRWICYIGGLYFVLIFGVYGAGYVASSFIYAAF